MKMLTGLFSLALSFGTIASTVDTKSFVYDGTVSSVELLLSTEKTHTEYRTENRQSTCYRQEIVTYRRVCRGGGGHYPRPYPRPYPGPRHCWSEPVYRSVPYTCYQSVRIPFEVKDYDVEARVIVDVTKLSSETTPGETFKVTMKGDVLTFEVEASKKFFVVKKENNVRASMNGSVKMIDALLAAELIEAAPVLKSLSVSEMAVDNGTLKFNLGSEAGTNVGLDLKVEKLKTFGSDTTLLERELQVSEFSVNGTEVIIDLTKLGVQLENGKFRLTAKAFAKFNGNLMNGTQFSELSNSGTLIYKIR